MKTIRVVVEVKAPDHITQRDLARKVGMIIQYPIQLGRAGGKDTLVKAKVKWFTRVFQAELIKRKTNAPHDD